MQYGICLESSALAEACEAGYDFAELRVSELLPLESDAEFAPIRSALLASPLPVQVCNCFLPGTLKIVGPAVDHAGISGYMEVALRRAAEVGVAIIVFGSGAARQSPDGFPLHLALQQFSDAARLAAEIAARHDIIIALEPLNAGECNIVNTVAEGLHIVQNINHPHLRLLADILHMSRQGEPFSNLPHAVPYLSHVHLATVPIPGLHGDLNYDTPAFFTPLRDGGYQGRFSLEHYGNYLGNAPSTLSKVELLRKQLEAMKSQWNCA